MDPCLTLYIASGSVVTVARASGAVLVAKRANSASLLAHVGQGASVVRMKEFLHLAKFRCTVTQTCS